MKNIPNHLDDPQQVLLWEFDEFIILAIMFGIGIMVNYLGVLLLTGLVSVKFYRRVKDRQSSGFLLHWIYWHMGLGSSDKKPTSLPLSFIRRFF